eukprot:149303_1
MKTVTVTTYQSTKSMILPLLERAAVFQVFDNDASKDSCIGCEIDYHGAQCLGKCTCLNGYCDDDLYGTGDCFCTVMSYGANCTMCDGTGGSCDPMKGVCNSGPQGDGTCKLCYDLQIHIAQNISNSTFDFGLGGFYGAQCADNCSCNTKNGLCFTIGNESDERAGHCIYCTNSLAWGMDCDVECDCDGDAEYCSNGVHGTGCTQYDYGGLLNDVPWTAYVMLAAALFVILFSITWWHANKHFKQLNNGKSMPCCPTYSGGDIDHNGHVNDLRQSIIKYDHDQDEPPAVSIEHNKEPQTFQM